MKLEFSGQIFFFFEKYSNINSRDKFAQWEPSCSMRRDGRTDKRDEANSRFPRLCARVIEERIPSRMLPQYEVHSLTHHRPASLDCRSEACWLFAGLVDVHCEWVTRCGDSMVLDTGWPEEVKDTKWHQFDSLYEMWRAVRVSQYWCVIHCTNGKIYMASVGRKK